MTFKKVLGIAGVALASTVVLAACSGDNSADDKNVVRVGIMTKTDATEPIWIVLKNLLRRKVWN